MRTNERVTGVVKRDGKILLIHRFKHGQEYYVFPGGGVEEGESWEEALIREMREETGLEIISFQFLYQTGSETTFIFYNCVLGPGEPHLGGPELQNQSEENQYILEWIETERIFDLPSLYPTPDKDRIFKQGCN